MVLRNLKNGLCNFNVFTKPLVPVKNKREAISQSTKNGVTDGPKDGWTKLNSHNPPAELGVQILNIIS